MLRDVLWLTLPLSVVAACALPHASSADLAASGPSGPSALTISSYAVADGGLTASVGDACPADVALQVVKPACPACLAKITLVTAAARACKGAPQPLRLSRAQLAAQGVDGGFLLLNGVAARP